MNAVTFSPPVVQKARNPIVGLMEKPMNPSSFAKLGTVSVIHHVVHAKPVRTFPVDVAALKLEIKA